MTTQQSNNLLSVALVCGGRSPIAIACAMQFSTFQDVVLVTRRVDDEMRQEVSVGAPRLTLVAADLTRTGQLLK